jgi:hypothetical protein
VLDDWNATLQSSAVALFTGVFLHQSMSAVSVFDVLFQKEEKLGDGGSLQRFEIVVGLIFE